MLLARPAIAAKAVDEAGFVRIGGIEQWVGIRGSDARNPVIVFLHGGPSEAQSPLLHWFRPWERQFTVVNWDQRGSGKTYGRNGPSTPELTVTRLTDDAIELTEHVLNRLSQRKVILVGQSWGSFLGMTVIKRRPELFHAFVGTGQHVSIAASSPYQLQWARQLATNANDQESLAALGEAASAPPDRMPLAVRQAANKWLVAQADIDYANEVRAFVGTAAEQSKGDAADWKAGREFSERNLLPAVVSADLRALGLNVPIPYFIVQGRDDHITPSEAAKSYFEEVRAPAKAFVAIDGGHYACFTNAEHFVGALREHVGPLVR